jgi:lathosterol oxidase
LDTMSHFEKFESYIPQSLFHWQAALLAFALMYVVICFRYFLMVGPVWWVFYRGFQNATWIRRRRLYTVLPTTAEQVYELKWSLITSSIFAFSGLWLAWTWEAGLSQIYLRFDEHGWWYFFASPVLLMLVHDTYFYWTHRWLHLPWVYRRFHIVHHASLKPSPWASFSFHPGESVINALALPLIVLFLPVHPVVLIFHLTLMTVTAIFNHLGYETLPSHPRLRFLAKHWISGLHHAQHHRSFRYNYALFFPWWDQWMGTEHPDFDQEFSELFKPSNTKAK